MCEYSDTSQSTDLYISAKLSNPDQRGILTTYTMPPPIPLHKGWLGEKDTGCLGDGVGRALAHWALDGALYMIVLGQEYGLFLGFVCRNALNLAPRWRWIDKACFCLIPFAIGIFVAGACGCFRTDEPVAFFIPGGALNWDGNYHGEIETRHDSLNQPSKQSYRNHHLTTNNTRHATPTLPAYPINTAGPPLSAECLQELERSAVYGFFGRIRLEAISYVEYARRLLPDPGNSDSEINTLTVPSIEDCPVEVLMLSQNEATSE
ncbi:Cation/H+ exchanger [Penicillium argentinense]|uniref:Cation/H+ exchanger n=1 Tax=Penicillium argentinense TaxID=1131581 RepID=A0A9W9G4I8_9EURO|nr:Cation/H+ exchanger [Penicillium argentinense]KAJ5112016.1 Cation/H+ exchanger [Penicillium argentinense]